MVQLVVQSCGSLDRVSRRCPLGPLPLNRDNRHENLRIKPVRSLTVCSTAIWILDLDYHIDITPWAVCPYQLKRLCRRTWRDGYLSSRPSFTLNLCRLSSRSHNESDYGTLDSSACLSRSLTNIDIGLSLCYIKSSRSIQIVIYSL